jgi:hypothetical protein
MLGSASTTSFAEARAAEDEPERPDADLGAGCDADEVTAAAGGLRAGGARGVVPGPAGMGGRPAGANGIGRVAGSRSGADPLIDDMSAARRPSISVLATYRCQAWA